MHQPRVAGEAVNGFAQVGAASRGELQRVEVAGLDQLAGAQADRRIAGALNGRVQQLDPDPMRNARVRVRVVGRSDAGLRQGRKPLRVVAHEPRVRPEEPDRDVGFAELGAGHGALTVTARELLAVAADHKRRAGPDGAARRPRERPGAIDHER